MLPHFARLNREVAGSPVQVPPPPGFRFVKEPVLRAEWRFETDVLFPPGMTSAQKAGLRYEKKIILELVDMLQKLIHVAPTIEYEDAAGLGYAIPDAVISDNHGICVVEIKYQHMPDAWWQLRKKYEPLVRHIHPDKKIHLVEICRSLDCAMPFPEPLKVVESIAELRDMESGSLGVLQWKL